MKKLMRPVMVLVTILSVGACAYGQDDDYGWLPGGGGSGGSSGGGSGVVRDYEITDINTKNGILSGFGNTGQGARISYDSFRYSIRKRMEMMRMTDGFGGQSFGNSAGRRPVGGGYSGGDRNTYENRGGGYYNQNYNNYAPPPSSFNQNWNPPPLPNPNYNAPYNAPNAPSSYDPYGGGGNVNTNWNQQNFSQPYSYNDSFASDSAYAMAPSSRSSRYYSSNPRRQLDCVYYSGFTVWADLYQTWAKQKTRSRDEGFKYRTFGPAIGADWTNGPVTLGAAMTYNWGKLRGRDIDHSQKQDSFALEFYGQYSMDNWYVNGSLGFAHNRYDSDRTTPYTVKYKDGKYGDMYAFNHDKFSSNSWNFDIEYGWKFVWNGVKLTPNIGLRYFHDRRGSINEGYGDLAIRAGGKNYSTFEIPMILDASYEFVSGNKVFIPRGKFGIIPELARKNGEWSGSVQKPDGSTWHYSENGAKRNRWGFLFGLGVDARLTKAWTAHLDYNVNFRSGQYEHHWNFGAGYTF